MSTKKSTDIPVAKLDQYKKLIATLKGLEVKGATMPYTSVNSHMFSFLDKNGELGLRLPEETRSAFLTKFKAVLMEQHGTILKEYVAVPAAVFEKTTVLEPYFREAFNYVKSLKPKSTSKK